MIRHIPKKAQAEVIKANGLMPCMYVVLQDLNNTIIVRHIVSGEIKVLNKQGGNSNGR